MGGRTGRGMARGNAPFLERGCSESAGGVSQKKSRREPYIVRDDLAGDEGFEPPQTESESGVLPLHKSPMPSPLKRHLLLYAKIGICQGLFFFLCTCSISRSSRRIRDRDTGVIPRKDATCRWGTRSITPG